MKIFIIGYMGSGKSKTADALSKLLKLSLIETDQEVEKLEGKTISEIFNSAGQDYFRELEKQILRATEKVDAAIISTGGGLPCYNDNMEWMNKHGITIYLEANPGLLFHRLSSSKSGRPLIENLNDVELMEQISGHLAIRSSIYKKAHISVNAASLNVKLLAEKIQAKLNS